METHRGRRQDPLRQPFRQRDSIDDPELFVDVVISSGDWVDEVSMAYHHGEIAQALSALTFTQREVVFYKFWGGWSNAEIAAHQHRSPRNVEESWRTQIRPRLVRELGSLSGLC
jgi:DNA-directed RNA polymerase specialized sigma24 family protein